MTRELLPRCIEIDLMKDGERVCVGVINLGEIIDLIKMQIARNIFYFFLFEPILCMQIHNRT